MERVREILDVYKQFGPSGMPVAAMIEHDLRGHGAGDAIGRAWRGKGR